ncbi:MAG: AraC family transcriptional regulator ligand-binding domain-containing protein [Gammaproteobacteria bacterium]|nr:AraC family transcriptional regulator ligand-binding domain-containing protein [Gammaproteobacteria bacterium]
MKQASKFTVSPNWQVLLNDMQIDTAAALVYAGLPADLFTRHDASLSPSAYFRLWHGLEAVADGREIPLLLAEHLSAEAFDAPLFAALCSPDLNTALRRIKQYKPLIGPLNLNVEIGQKRTSLAVACYGHPELLPATLALSELVFFTALARLATRKKLSPLKIVLPDLPDRLSAYTAYFGCKPVPGKRAEIHFAADDARRPFLTANAAMWTFFEENLQRRLADLDATATTTERVKAVLLESLPAGDSAIETVAARLATSKRSLQRKLAAEAQSYQSVLQSVRAELADHYLQESTISLGEISFLLGFQEASSFIRAFTAWKGLPPGSYRQQFR